ncbi:adenosylcobinamide-GDP ribazoletransferase [Ruegeria sp. HKCCD7239]|uniref:adenosylcobinamide-GDP ribazoletransferase n=1 Tax=unclassified Ruegeria TaxID=2625375 RepID=UPI0035300F9D
MFNQSDQSGKTQKGMGVQKTDTNLVSRWDIPVALVLLTRLPLPRLPEHVFERQADAAWAFPVVGLVVGLLASAIGWACVAVNLPPLASAILVIAVLILCTGAMHEDGLADTVDGFWGGFTPERRLEIMKDSQIGTYGVLALLISQGLRVVLIATLLSQGGLSGILAACIVSRAAMPVLMASLPNARRAGLSHSVGAPSAGSVALGALVALVCAMVLVGAPAMAAILVIAICLFVIAVVAKAKIRGQTGDVLGATQQVSEIAFLLVLVVAS